MLMLRFPCVINNNYYLGHRLCKVVLQRYGLLATNGFAILEAASGYFTKNFNHLWVSLQVNNQQLIRAINRHRKTFNEYAIEGLLN